MPYPSDETRWIDGDHDMASISDVIADNVQAPQHRRVWLRALAVATVGLGALVVAVFGVFWWYIGIWGVDVPVMWGIAITNFVWWVGIAHAGTLISAILLLANQAWRRSINRFAEAMTLFSVACAAMFPLLHLGRPEFFYWLFPYPNTYGYWPQFLSPLVWDFFAVATYGTVSLVFWYIGLVPDLGTMRDRSTGLRARVYGVFALGWRGSARHWERHQTAYLMLAGLATTLVVSVHTIVSFDFAVAQFPGWHTTVFPPYFVAGAIFSGFAMVLTLLIPVRAWLGLQDFVTIRHLDHCAKLMLTAGLVVAYGYLAELFFGWYSGDPHERELIASHLHGRSAPLFWTVVALNVVFPQSLWWRRARRHIVWLFVLSLLINLGMWLERWLIVITSLEHGLLPTTGGTYFPTFWDWLTLAGTLGFFAFFMLLFIRYVPVIAMSELRELVAHRRREAP
ncbi:NrfD/PsrC family molybdoenzyme membrane anchor subunit [Nannocystis radixulma]|uniref:Polysulfide reductase NrfD n=1 Tax=Nannocystis radixulma TaxID=2995305 RepID=A0ABT5B2R9_9BACT|nr:NrfD/PsrC family molybdoenzyme membrane anchor subunit [Nannocystis radixulma]MDC0668402.1 polysulfide reductase NrfD [Nannocystis radixulma]